MRLPGHRIQPDWTDRHEVAGLVRARPDFLLTDQYPPSRMADFAGEWKEMGAQIIGTCCASGTEDIMAMRPVVKADS